MQAGLPLGDERPEVPMARVAGWELEIFGSHGRAVWSHDLAGYPRPSREPRGAYDPRIEKWRVTLQEKPRRDWQDGLRIQAEHHHDG